MSDCIFCGAKAKSKEHLFGKWMQKVYKYDPNPKGKQPHYENGFGVDGRRNVADGFAAQSGHPMNRTIKNAVCRSCNNGWMSQIDDEMRTIYGGLQNHPVFSLSKGSTQILANWLILKTFVYASTYPPEKWALADNSNENLGIEPEVIFAELSEKYRNQTKAFFETRAIPGSWFAYIARTKFVGHSLGGANYITSLKLVNGKPEIFFVFVLTMGDLCFFVAYLPYQPETSVQTVALEVNGAKRVVPFSENAGLIDKRALTPLDFETIAMQLLPTLMEGGRRSNFDYSLPLNYIPKTRP